MFIFENAADAILFARRNFSGVVSESIENFTELTARFSHRPVGSQGPIPEDTHENNFGTWTTKTFTAIGEMSEDAILKNFFYSNSQHRMLAKSTSTWYPCTAEI